MGTTCGGGRMSGFCGGDHKNEASRAKLAKARSYEKPEQKARKFDVLPGECLIKQTFDLKKDLITLSQKYPKKYEPLLSRNVISIENDNKSETIKENCISVLQFNMLADGLSTSYISKVTEKTFLNVDPLCLQWTYRGLRICEEILRCKPDIIAIEECDQLQFIMKYLSPIGYNSYYQPKTISPVRYVIPQIVEERKLNKDTFKMNNDGLALIYNTNKFKIANKNDVQCFDMKTNKEKLVALAVPLMFTLQNNIEKEILFVVTHLKSTKTEKGEELRERQINLLFKELIKNEKNLPIVLCCDLNANPIKNKKGYEPLCYNSIIDENNLGFASVYKLANGAEPKYTSFKLRKTGKDQHTLDYIFIKPAQNGWNINKILDIPTEAVIPNWSYPSDHISIFAELEWIGKYENDEKKADD